MILTRTILLSKKSWNLRQMSSLILVGYLLCVMVAFIVRADVVEFYRRPWLARDSVLVAFWPYWLGRTIYRMVRG
jgi:hypothetical protein